MSPSIVPLQAASDATKFGGKAKNLAALFELGLPVPNGFAVSLAAFGKDSRMLMRQKKLAEQVIDPSKLYAVRSSALAEDSLSASWAGQFDTYLNTPASQVIEKIETCHKSVGKRALAYAGSTETGPTAIAVVVQEMVAPTHAGLAFTKDPSSGANKVLVEYVKGLGEPLVHGDVDPQRITWDRKHKLVMEQTEPKLPIPLGSLITLCEKIEAGFKNVPQDIEWAYDGSQIWLVQTRPITTLQDRGVGKHYLGEPGNLFYWGPSRASALYMSDFTSAAERFFARTLDDPSLPGVPKTLVLFHQDKVVWLIQAKEFGKFVTGLFKVYEKTHDLELDKKAWFEATRKLDDLMASKNTSLKQFTKLLEAAWRSTLFSEFSLYGAESVLHERLSRFVEKQSQEIWGTMTLPDEPTFMQRVDIELLASNLAWLARKYPWIQDGYQGVVGNAKEYFEKRLEVVKGNILTEAGSAEKRLAIANKYGLIKSEIRALDLARELSVFMDERKAWMMRTRQYLQVVEDNAVTILDLTHEQAKQSTIEDLVAGKPKSYYGASFMKGKAYLLSHEDVDLAWDWYVEFRASHKILSGIVASSAGRHFINGEVFIARTPYDAMPDDALLVVPSTSPSYVPLMRKARALVTDHGGMMSHAAIVAREFGLPCIVGTKRATKILKDGDKVVLDLVKGEINK